MARPVKPSVPTEPSRQRPDEFSDDAEAFMAFHEEFIDYLHEVALHSEVEALNSLAAAAVRLVSNNFLSNNRGKAIAVANNGRGLVGRDLGGIAIASGDQARAGTNNTTAMSPQRTRQAIQALGPDIIGWRRIAAKTATNQEEITFSTSGGELDASEYSDYMLVLRNILPSSDGGNIRIRGSFNGGRNDSNYRVAGGNWATGSVDLATSVGTGADETGVSGRLLIVNLHADRGAMMVFDGLHINSSGAVVNDNVTAQLQRPSSDGPLNFVALRSSAPRIASGEAVLYGLVD